MADVPLPLLNAPGRQPQAAGGRLINGYPEKLPATAGKPYAYWRVPGLRPWGTSPGSNYRGALVVGQTLYAVISNTVYTFPVTGGAGTPLTGTVLGTVPVTMARNNKQPSPDIVIVSPGDGAFYIDPAAPGTVVAYPGAVVGQPNAVVFHKGFFIFTYGNGLTRTTGVNVVTMNALDNANAESKPDTLYRPIPLGNGQLLLCGSTTIEVWGGSNDPGVAGYPFNYISTIARGIVGPNAIAGNDDGWGKGIFLVGDDFKVSTLDGYMPVPISTPDLDLQIESEPDKTVITVSVYVSQGHGVVVVQGPQWCWEYDTTLQTWHERKSHLVDYWRGKFPIAANGQWICGDRKSGNLAVVDGLKSTEFGQNDVQSISITGGPTGGTFTLTLDGQITSAIPFNATAAQVQTALQSLGRVGVGNIDCTNGPLPAAVTVRFKDALAAKPMPLITAASSLTGGALPAVVVTQALGALGDPLLIQIESGPLPAFPSPLRINAIELYLTKGVGRATGADPLETDPDISIAISRDGGQTWSNPRVVKIGRQSLTDGRVRSAIWGQAQNQGVRWRLRESAPLSFAFMGADMQVDQLR